jgi:N-acetyl-alpha-D-muramate 1-phosphate uridylyltransferase
MKAMIFAAGLGTRLKPFTNHHPKALAEVNGKTLLQRNIEYLQQFGINEVLVNVHHFADQIIQAISVNNGWGSKVTISDETDAVLETGGGLKKAAGYFENEDCFLVMNADILTNLHIPDLIRQHQQLQPLATLAVTNRVSSRYFLFNQQNQLCGWRNVQTNEEKGAVIHFTSEQKIALQPKAFSGIQIIQSAIFPKIIQEGKFSIVDVYLHLCKTHSIIAFDHSDSLLIDVGKPENILKAAKLFT